MNDIIDAYLREVETRLRGERADKRAIVQELRSHLVDRVTGLMAEDPGISEEEAARQAVRAFGDPAELALSYGPSGPELSSASGETVLRIGRAVGRGTGKVLKGVGIGLLALLVVVSALGIWAFYEVRPYVEDIVERNAERSVYSFHTSCKDAPCTEEQRSQTFYIHPSARSVQLDLRAWDTRDDVSQGSLEVRVTTPDGTLAYNRTLQLDGRSSLSEEASWAPLSGNWTVDVRVSDLVGTVSVHVEAVGMDDISGDRR